MNREAQILAAMPTASLAEQRMLAQELEAIRASRRASLRGERDDAVAEAMVTDLLTPTVGFTAHTAATDWMDEVAPGGDATEVHLAAKAEATNWVKRVSAAVKEDADEFIIQAEGYARVWGGQFGLEAAAAKASFVAQAMHLAGFRSFASLTVEAWPKGSTTCHSCKMMRVVNENGYCSECQAGVDRRKKKEEAASKKRHERYEKSKTRKEQDKARNEDNLDYNPSTASLTVEAEPKGWKKCWGCHNTKKIKDRGLCASCFDEREAVYRKQEDQKAKNKEKYQKSKTRKEQDKARNEDNLDYNPSTASLTVEAEKHACATCGKPATKYAYQEGNRASGHFACDAHIGQWSNGRKVVNASRRTAAQSRPLWEIAQEIRRDWRNVPNWRDRFFGAVPYLEAMEQLDSINDMYVAESGRSIVAYFIGNVGNWKGEVASRVKAELRAMLSGKSASRRTAGADTDYESQFVDLTPEQAAELDAQYRNSKDYMSAKEAFMAAARTEGRGIDVAFARVTGPYPMYRVWSGAKGQPSDSYVDWMNRQGGRRTAAIVRQNPDEYELTCDNCGEEHEFSPFRNLADARNEGQQDGWVILEDDEDDGVTLAETYCQSCASELGIKKGDMPYWHKESGRRTAANDGYGKAVSIADGSGRIVHTQVFQQEAQEILADHPDWYIVEGTGGRRTAADTGIYCSRCKGQQVVNLGGVWRNCPKCKGSGLNKKNIPSDVWDIVGEGSLHTAGSGYGTAYDNAPREEQIAYSNFVAQGYADSDSAYYAPLDFESWRRGYWDESKNDTTYAPGMPPMAGSFRRRAILRDVGVDLAEAERAFDESYPGQGMWHLVEVYKFKGRDYSYQTVNGDTEGRLFLADTAGINALKSANAWWEPIDAMGVDTELDALSSFRRRADQGFGPDEDSQSGHAESDLEMVDVENAPEDSNLGWITQGSYHTAAPQKDSSGFRRWKCQKCGSTVSSYEGADTSCHRCGTSYNGSGELIQDSYDDAREEYSVYSSRRTAGRDYDEGYDAGQYPDQTFGEALSAYQSFMSEEEIQAFDLDEFKRGWTDGKNNAVRPGSRFPNSPNMDWLDRQGSLRTVANDWAEDWDNFTQRGYDLTTERDEDNVVGMDTADQDDYYFLRGFGMTHQQAIKTIRSRGENDLTIFEQFEKGLLATSSLRRQADEGFAGNMDGTMPAGATPMIQPGTEPDETAMFEPDELDTPVPSDAADTAGEDYTPTTASLWDNL